MIQKLLNVLEVARSFKFANGKYLSGSMRCNIYTFYSEQLASSFQILVNRLPGSALFRVQPMFKNEVPPRYCNKLITKLLAESDPSGLAGLHFFYTEAFLEYISCLKMKHVIYT